MAITKRIRVSFDLKMVLSSKEEETLCRQLAELTKAYSDGAKLNGLQVAMVKAAMESGPEYALELSMKKTIKDMIVEVSGEYPFNVSNFRFEVRG